MKRIASLTSPVAALLLLATVACGGAPDADSADGGKLGGGPVVSELPAQATKAEASRQGLAKQDVTDSKVEVVPAPPADKPPKGQPTLSQPTKVEAPQAVQPDLEMVEVQPGQVYEAGTRVNMPTVGVSFVIPEGWIGNLPEGSPAFLLGSRDEVGMVLMMAHQGASAGQVATELGQPIPLDEGLFLQTEGRLQVADPWVLGPISATDGQDSLPGYLMAVVREGGGGVLFVGFGEAGSGFYQELVGKVTATALLSTPTGAAGRPPIDPKTADDSSPLAQQWSQRFRGMRLTFIESISDFSGGSGSKFEYHLCSDGRFASRGVSSTSVESGGGMAGIGGTSSGTGRWRVITQGNQAILELNWDGGSPTYGPLESVGGGAEPETYIAGERWFVTPDNPSCP